MAQQWMDENDPRLLEEVEKARRMAEKYAAHSGYALNPDREALAGIYRGLARNKLQYGHRYCPLLSLNGGGTGPRAGPSQDLPV